MKPNIFTLLFVMLLISTSVLTQPGTLDSAFGKDGKVFTAVNYIASANAVTILSNGKILAAGYAQTTNQNSAFALLKYKQNGKLDSSFGRNGIVITYIKDSISIATAMAVETDGKILLTGYTKLKKYNNAFALARYKANGKPDDAFGDHGIVITDFGKGDDEANAVAIQPDGKIIAAGYADTGTYPNLNTNIAVVRYLGDGRIDSSFGINGKILTDFKGTLHSPPNADYANAITVLRNGKIIAAGATATYDGPVDLALVRYKSNGALDSSFGQSGTTYGNFSSIASPACSMAILPNGKILLAGYSLSLGSFFVIAEYKKNGELDSSFGQNGVVLINYPKYSENFGKSIVVQKNGKIIVAGFGSPDNKTQQLELMRFKPHGVLDSSFGTNGVVFLDVQSKFTLGYTDHAPALALQKDGKIVVAGNGSNQFALVRFIGDCVPDHSFVRGSSQNTSFGSLAYLSPNPVKDILYVQNLSTSIKSISIIDMSGKILQQVVTSNNNYSFNVKQLSAGMYFVKINSDNRITSFKFLKE